MVAAAVSGGRISSSAHHGIGSHTFHLARDTDARVVCGRVMHLGVRELAAAVSAATLIFCCSCEKHRLGEDPEVQKEQVDETKGGEEKASAAEEKSTSPAEKTSPTPVEFFPATTPTP